MLSQLAVAGAALVAGLAPGAVTYDPETRTGFVAAADVREAFGWSEATLAAKAAGVEFHQTFDTEWTYAVVCGKYKLQYVHHWGYGYYALNVDVAEQSDGYHRGPAGFRIDGSYAGISGATTPPRPGDPCPAEKPGMPKLDRIDLLTSVHTWSLAAISGDLSETLLTHHEPGEKPE